MQLDALNAFRALDAHATMQDMLEACRDLFMHSTEHSCATPCPFDRSEVDAVANAILEYIVGDPLTPAIREIVFSITRPLEGKSIEYTEYASMFSSDMLFESASVNSDSLDTEGLRRDLKKYCVAILFRYSFCAAQTSALFPVSVILDYLDNVKILLTREGRAMELPDVVLTTLRALRSLETEYRGRDPPDLWRHPHALPRRRVRAWHPATHGTGW